MASRKRALLQPTDDWRLAIELPRQRRQRHRRPALVQAMMFDPDELAHRV